MYFVDLEMDFVLLSFPDYNTYKAARLLLASKYRDIAYGGELARLREIQCKHWVMTRHGGYMDYQYSLADYANPPGLAKPKPWLATGKDSLQSAGGELENRGAFKALCGSICRKR